MADPVSSVAAGSQRSVCSARARPSTTGSTASRWLGLGITVTSTALAVASRSVPEAPRWYLTSSAWRSSGITSLVEAARLELGQDRLVAHSHDLGQHVEPSAVRHADDRPVRALLRCHLQDQLSSIGTRVSSPSMLNRFCPR